MTLQRYMRVLRPLVGRMLRSQRLRGGPALLEREPDFPYAHVVRAHSGPPISPTLARTLEARGPQTR